MKLKKETIIIIVVTLIVTVTAAWFLLGNRDNNKENVEENEINIDTEAQKQLFNTINEVGEESEDFDSVLVIQAYEVGKSLFPDERITIVYSNDESGKIMIEGKECYQVIIVKENSDKEVEDNILGYIALSLNSGDLFYKEVNGEYKEITFDGNKTEDEEDEEGTEQVPIELPDEDEVIE